MCTTPAVNAPSAESPPAIMLAATDGGSGAASTAGVSAITTIGVLPILPSAPIPLRLTTPAAIAESALPPRAVVLSASLITYRNAPPALASTTFRVAVSPPIPVLNTTCSITGSYGLKPEPHISKPSWSRYAIGLLVISEASGDIASPG